MKWLLATPSPARTPGIGENEQLRCPLGEKGSFPKMTLDTPHLRLRGSRIAEAWAGGGSRAAEPLVNLLLAALARKQVAYRSLYHGFSSSACVKAPNVH